MAGQDNGSAALGKRADDVEQLTFVVAISCHFADGDFAASIKS
jgi:hypothetical protein